MSARDSSDVLVGTPRDPAAEERFSRWPRLLGLSLGVLLGPIIALANQQLIYTTNMWACGRGMQRTMHIVPLLCLIVSIGAGLTAYRDWKAVGGGVEDEAATVDTRTRFLAILGMIISVFSSLVIIAQWSTIFVFDACMRA